MSQFTCDICALTGRPPVSFNTIGGLRKHMSVHQDKPTFKCQYCERVFSREKNLITHIQQHNPNSNLRCLRCDQVFSISYHLETHIRANKCKNVFPDENENMSAGDENVNIAIVLPIPLDSPVATPVAVATPVVNIDGEATILQIDIYFEELAQLNKFAGTIIKYTSLFYRLRSYCVNIIAIIESELPNSILRKEAIIRYKEITEQAKTTIHIISSFKKYYMNIFLQLTPIYQESAREHYKRLLGTT
jgi:uncharacterized C2H2 Zn-finger protein